MKDNITARMSSGKEYDCAYQWTCFVQCGASGVVFSKSGSYKTAFFEAFPNNPKCFLRGEGFTIEEAERNCWDKYQKILTCTHEMERRSRVDGYGYCKHCSYSGMVFEPLTKCCKCKNPTNYIQDYKENWYCKKHQRFIIKNPNPGCLDIRYYRKPRKLKKQLKKKALIKFQSQNIIGKLEYKVTCLNNVRFKCNGYFFELLK